MLKGFWMVPVMVFLTLGLFTICFAEESITITTYYPSPYGSYNTLYVAGNVGVGTSSPVYPLDVRGNTAINGASFYVRSSPSVTWDFLKFSVDGSIGRLDIKQVDFRMGVNNTTDAGETFTDVFSITQPNGNVGIGIASPTAKLHVNGNIKAVLTDFPGAGLANVLYNSGTNEIGYDVAELFEANEEVEPGDVLSIDENGKLKKSSKPYDSKVAGVVSEAPAILFEGSQLQIAPQPFEFRRGNKPPLALAGRVKCKVTTEGSGPIKVGDLLVTSDKSGYAMKADYNKLRFGVILGKALGSLDSGDGKVNVLVTLE
ncbi:MAG: hypothetical protein HY350_04935 [Candidatus Omnitrophica bacterium]|nr:hypothetical protein [Candidatus Omnitrophota bacterium]